MEKKFKITLIIVSIILAISLILNIVLLIQKNKKDETPYKITYNGISTYSNSISVNISFTNYGDTQIKPDFKDFSINYNGIRITAESISAYNINDLGYIKKDKTHYISINFEVTDPNLLEEFYYCGEYLFTI